MKPFESATTDVPEGVDVVRLRAQLVPLAKDTGKPIVAEDFKLEFLPGDRVPGLVAFRATYGSGRDRNVIAGVLEQSGDIQTGRYEAVARVLEQWQQAEAVPSPVVMAETAVFLLAGYGAYSLVADEDDANTMGLDRDREKLTPPAPIDDPKKPGVEFWWFKPMGLHLARLQLDRPRTIKLVETPAAKVKAKG